MFTLRRSAERGRSNLDWLDSYHSFSFADYEDPRWMGFGNLRVINEDVIQPGKGFAMHAHRDMEIITYVVNGALAHKDNMGNGSIIRPGDIQRMSAGTGIKHSEFNASQTEPLHLLQIWITPQTLGIQPGYEQKQITKVINQLTVIGSPQNISEGITIHQTVQVSVGCFTADSLLSHPLQQQRCWLQIIKGQMRANDHLLQAGDGLAIEGEQALILQCLESSEVLLFEGI